MNEYIYIYILFIYLLTSQRVDWESFKKPNVQGEECESWIWKRLNRERASKPQIKKPGLRSIIGGLASFQLAGRKFVSGRNTKESPSPLRSLCRHFDLWSGRVAGRLARCIAPGLTSVELRLTRLSLARPSHRLAAPNKRLVEFEYETALVSGPLARQERPTSAFS